MKIGVDMKICLNLVKAVSVAGVQVQYMSFFMSPVRNPVIFEKCLMKQQ